jgi:hypothetical protein
VLSWPDRCYISVGIGMVTGWRAGPRVSVPVRPPVGDALPRLADHTR